MSENADGTAALPYRTLRLALAMRGGVSLAVWIGGAVAEIDLFRRACKGWLDDDPPRRARGEKYRQLLADTNRYQDVEVDILAGASAGGLNAVLFGLAQSCGTVMDDIVRQTWLCGGGIWDLLREPGFGRVPSILKGDERLFTVARDALGKIAGEVDPPATSSKNFQVTSAPVSNVTVELAATLLDDPRHPRRPNRARFSFTRTPGDLPSGFSTIPGAVVARQESADADRDRWECKVALDRLALAARATSSFPGAFEPACIYSVSSGAVKPGITAPNPPDYVQFGATGVNMARAFQYSRTQGAEPNPFYVVDGGIFDNIPIDRAIQAIQRAPAGQPSERFLIYLDPEPPNPQEPITATRDSVSAVSWLPTIQRSLTLKQRNETEGDELSLVREHNDSVMETRGRLDALAAVMRTLRSQADGVGATRDFVTELITDEAYLKYRIAVDGPRIGRLLTNPTAELCYPPDEAVDYTELNPREAVRIREQLIALFTGATEAKVGMWKLDSDVCAMLDWTRVLIAWVRALEDLINDYRAAPAAQKGIAPLSIELTAFFGGDNLATLGDLKRRLYRWLTVLTEAKHRTVDEVLAAPLRRENAKYGTHYPLAERLQISRGQQFALRLTPSLLAQLAGGPDAQCHDFYEELAKPNRFLNEGEPLADAVTKGLAAILAEIRGLSEPAIRDLWPLHKHLAAVPPWLARWTESIYPHFSLAPLRSYPIEQLSRIFTVTGVPDTAAIISYGRISSKEQPCIDVDDLDKAAKVKILDSWLRKPPRDDAELVRVLARKELEPEAKLAGNALMRFGGFLDWRWRENDWQWGRLDAAAGLVKLLVRARQAPLSDQAGSDALADDEPDLEGMKRSGLRHKHSDNEKTPREHHTRDLQKRILEESERLKDPAKDSTKTIVETVGADTMNAISPHYRFALASRIVPLIYRAMWPVGQPVLSIPGGLARLANFVARPLAVPVPLIADPLRLAAALVVVLGTAGLLGAGRTTPLWAVAFAVVLFALGVGIVARAWRAGRNLALMRGRLTNLDKAFPDLGIEKHWMPPLVAANRRDIRVGCWALGIAVMVSAVAIGGVGVWQKLPLPAESLIAVFAVAFGTQHWLNRRFFSVGHRKVMTRRGGWAGLTGLGALAVIVVPPVLAYRQSAVWPWDDLAVGVPVAAIAVALLTTLSVWGWVDDKWALGCVIAGLVLGALAQWALLDGLWWGPGLPILDLLPTAVWMLALGLVMARLPHRAKERCGEFKEPIVPQSIQVAATVSAPARDSQPVVPAPPPSSNGAALKTAASR